MAGKDTLKEGYGKLLEAWEAPDGAGDPIGCLATTFTFSPAFFEEECLSRFLKLETDAAEDGPVYLVEREEKLRQLTCATVIADQHHCQGSRSLRWDLYAARPDQGILHAKVSLLCWSRHIRVIVSSANLTEDGYRKNREVFGVLDYREGGDSPLALLKEMITFLRSCLKLTGISGPGTSLERPEGLLDRAGRMGAAWGDSPERHSRRALRVFPLITGPQQVDLFAQVFDRWPDSSPPGLARVVSPFYDPPESRHNRPAEAIWGIMRKRDTAQVVYCVETEDAGNSKKVFLKAPKSLLTSLPDRATCSIRMQALTGETERPLHAKEIWFQNDRWVGLVIGSSNFTSPGTGVGKVRNHEANLMYLLDMKRAPKGSHASMRRRFPTTAQIDQPEDSWEFLPPSGDDPDSPGDGPLLPAAFIAAVYRLLDAGTAQVELILGDTLPPGWTVSTDDNLPVAAETSWENASRSNPFCLPWQGRPPSGFWVTWTGASGSAWWPVNVASAEDLPPPDELKDLPLDVLIGILTSARPLHEAMRGYLRKLQRAKERKTTEGAVEFDPHKRVDTSGFLLQRTRRFSWALAGLRSRLERPAPTEDCLAWRLHGPVGVSAVAAALAREAATETERAFLIAELVLELTRIRPQTAPGALPSAQVRKALRELAKKLHAELQPPEGTSPKHLGAYLRKIADQIKAL